MTSKVQLRSKTSPAAAALAIGCMLTEASYDTLFTGAVDVYKPDGKLLAAIIKDAIPDDVYAGARDGLQRLRSYTSDNRGTYAGVRMIRALRRDGSQGNGVRAVDDDGKRVVVASSIVGFFERTPRHPFCRPTRFVMTEPERWATLIPLAQRVADAYRAHSPAPYDAQQAIASTTHPAYVIPGTPFTTLTVNHTVRGACHRDAGDLKVGLGCISAMRIGSFDGFHLAFPEYRVAFDIGPNDLLLFDPHEMHGNTPMKHASEGAERISVVYYFRAKMTECLSPEEELERAKQARGGFAEEDSDDDE